MEYHFNKETDYKFLLEYVKCFLDAQHVSEHQIRNAINVMDISRCPLYAADSKLCEDIVDAVVSFAEDNDIMLVDEHYYEVWDYVDEEEIVLDILDLYNN